MKRLLLTGAAGSMGKAIRPLLTRFAETIVVSGRKEIGDLAAGEESRPANLSDPVAVATAIEGCDGIIHLGGYSVEGPFGEILEANILGLYNLYEAARAAGMPRILFASSNHVVGYHPQSARLDARSLPKPDSLYGVSKCFGEALAQMYFEKFGQETAIVRIGSCFERPTDHRMLSTWLSHEDFVRLAERVFTVPRLGCPIIYGASANSRSWWDNSHVSYLGWVPQDNAESYAEEVNTKVPRPDPNSALHIYQGGKFTDLPIMKDQQGN